MCGHFYIGKVIIIYIAIFVAAKYRDYFLITCNKPILSDWLKQKNSKNDDKLIFHFVIYN